MEKRPHIRFVKMIPMIRGLKKANHIVMRYQRAFGLARGTGGVNYVDQMIGINLCLRIIRRFPFDFRPIIVKQKDLLII